MEKEQNQIEFHFLFYPFHTDSNEFQDFPLNFQSSGSVHCSCLIFSVANFVQNEFCSVLPSLSLPRKFHFVSNAVDRFPFHIHVFQLPLRVVFVYHLCKYEIFCHKQN